LRRLLVLFVVIAMFVPATSTALAGLERSGADRPDEIQGAQIHLV
jgi:hypothetical protein